MHSIRHALFTPQDSTPAMFFKKRPKPVAPIIHATDEDFESVISGDGVAVVDFWAGWCGPCRMMAPILDEVAIEFEERGVRLVKVDVDQAQQTAERFGIRSIPTLVFFENGEPLFEMVGLVPKPVLTREIEAVLAGEGDAHGEQE